jgi:hypothetical protein
MFEMGCHWMERIVSSSKQVIMLSGRIITGSRAMRSIRIMIAPIPILLLLCFLFAGCRERRALSDFTSDGCSLFPDRSLITEDDWCECCLDHDIAYWRGGTEEERLAADRALRDCVLEKTGNADLAALMYDGVRLGGSPYFYSWYRWGYGWSYGRLYQELTPGERALADRKLKEFFESNPQLPCDKTLKGHE